jgi:hypothetical protein
LKKDIYGKNPKDYSENKDGLVGLLTDEPEQRLPQTLDNQAFGKKFESLEIIF